MPPRSPSSAAPESESPRLGANLSGGGCSFAVWAPHAGQLGLELPGLEPGERRLFPLRREGELHVATVPGVREGERYQLVFPDGRRRPDPRSRRQPEGVHGPSAVVDLARLPGSRPRPALEPFARWVIYELHVGTFSPEGSFDGVAARLRYLREELGVTAIELMPVAPFPGSRGWGYDGVHPFAVQESYGGPAGLSRLIEAARAAGLAVILDVVYNHLGPDGNYLRDFGPYFTGAHHTPWGEAVNFDGPGSARVRDYFVENALQWVRDYGVDALRLDAIHAILDDSKPHVLARLAEEVQAAGGLVIAESDLNDPVVVRERARGGLGHDAQWSDDFHHALHTLLTGEREGYYADFGAASDLAAAYERGFVLDGSRSSRYRGAGHGKSAEGLAAEQLVVCLQNHDQVGNRARGDRLAQLSGLERARLGAVALLLSPSVPLLFMGEEYAAPQPFPYFTSHTDPVLARAVTEGRRREFEAFGWKAEVPDPQAEETFRSAILDLTQRETAPHAGLLLLHRELLALRREHPALQGPDRRGKSSARADDARALVVLRRGSRTGAPALLALLCFGERETAAELTLVAGRYRLVLDSADVAFGGAGRTAPAELVVPPGGRLELKLPARTAWLFEQPPEPAGA